MQFPEKIDSQLRTALGERDLLMTKLTDVAGDLAINLVVAALILTATLWAAGWLSGLVRRGLARMPGRRGADSTLQTFIGSIVRYGVLVMGLVAILQQLGVQATSILAVLGAASLAIGLAMQGTLSNVAAGVMLLILRPYRVGDFVEINGRLGTVQALDLFTTELASPEGLKVVMPNGKVFGEMIVNHSWPSRRRMEITIGIDYGDDIKTALDAMLAAARADERILTDPEPWAKCTGFADSAVNVTLRAWAPMSVFWDSYHDMLVALKTAFDQAGLSIPYPHQVEISKPGPAPVSPPAPAPDQPAGRRSLRSRPKA
jgi:small conductance mechanosensitive channel